MDNLEKIRSIYEKEQERPYKDLSDDWVKCRVALELLSLVPSFDFSEAEEDEDSYFVDSVCFFLRKHWIHPRFSELWVAYYKKGPFGPYESKMKIKSINDLSKVYSEKLDIIFEENVEESNG